MKGKSFIFPGSPARGIFLACDRGRGSQHQSFGRGGLRGSIPSTALPLVPQPPTSLILFMPLHCCFVVCLFVCF